MKPKRITSSEKIQEADSKPTILAKLIYRGIMRYIKANEAQNREKNYNKTLDFTGERRVNRNSIID